MLGVIAWTAAPLEPLELSWVEFFALAEVDWGPGLLEWVWRMAVGRAALVTLATF